MNIGKGAISVILTNQNKGQLFRCCKIDSLPEGALFRTCLPEAAKNDVRGFLQLKPKCSSNSNARRPGQNRPTEEFCVRVGNVLGSGPATARACLFPINFCKNLPKGGPLGKIVSMGTVMAENVVVRFYHEGKSRWYGLLSHTKVYRAPHLVGWMILPNQSLFHVSQTKHLSVKF